MKLRESRGVARLRALVLLVVLVGVVGLAVDYGLMVWTGHRLQIAADAAALAGAQSLREDASLVRDRSQAVAAETMAAGVCVLLRRNEENFSDGDIVVGCFDRDTGRFDSTGIPNAVLVNARRGADSLNPALQFLFAPVLNIPEADVHRSAIAMLDEGVDRKVFLVH